MKETGINMRNVEIKADNIVFFVIVDGLGNINE